jgi:hypothetical protein
MDRTLLSLDGNDSAADVPALWDATLDVAALDMGASARFILSWGAHRPYLPKLWPGRGSNQAMVDSRRSGNISGGLWHVSTCTSWIRGSIAARLANCGSAIGDCCSISVAVHVVVSPVHSPATALVR